MESFLPIVRFQKVDSLFPNRNIMRNQQRLQIATDIYSKSALLVKFTSCTIWQTSQRYLPKQRRNSGIQHLNCDVIHYSHTQQLLRGYFNFTDNFGTQQPHLWFRIMQIKLGKNILYNQKIQWTPRITSEIYSLKCGGKYSAAQHQECKVHKLW
jgi:hypothetical protein